MFCCLKKYDHWYLEERDLWLYIYWLLLRLQLDRFELTTLYCIVLLTGNLYISLHGRTGTWYRSIPYLKKDEKDISLNNSMNCNTKVHSSTERMRKLQIQIEYTKKLHINTLSLHTKSKCLCQTNTSTINWFELKQWVTNPYKNQMNYAYQKSIA